jgi:hypothetical protein
VLELGLLELDLLELELEPLPELADVLFWLCVADDWAATALGSPYAMPPPARTLAAPMATVIARSRSWPRSLALMAVRTDLRSVPTGSSSLAADLMTRCSQHDRPASEIPLRWLRDGSELPSIPGSPIPRSPTPGRRPASASAVLLAPDPRPDHERRSIVPSLRRTTPLSTGPCGRRCGYGGGKPGRAGDKRQMSCGRLKNLGTVSAKALCAVLTWQ